jgi:hypothetical protein
VDVGVAEPGAAGTSLQLQGSGTNYSGFVWVGPTNASAGTLNAGQTARATDPVQDHDRDGLPSAWELRYFGGITNAQCGCDPDGDGADNRAEWWAGTDPTNPASVLRMHGFAAGSHGIVLRWPSVSGRLYRVLSGPRPGHALMPLTNVAATAPVNVFTVRVDSAASGGFYRVGAGKPPE